MPVRGTFWKYHNFYDLYQAQRTTLSLDKNSCEEKFGVVAFLCNREKIAYLTIKKKLKYVLLGEIQFSCSYGLRGKISRFWLFMKVFTLLIKIPDSYFRVDHNLHLLKVRAGHWFSSTVEWILAEKIKKNKFSFDIFSGKCQGFASVEQLKLSGHLTHNVNKVGNNAKTVSSVICLYVFSKVSK